GFFFPYPKLTLGAISCRASSLSEIISSFVAGTLRVPSACRVVNRSLVEVTAHGMCLLLFKLVKLGDHLVGCRIARIGDDRQRRVKIFAMRLGTAATTSSIWKWPISWLAFCTFVYYNENY